MMPPDVKLTEILESYFWVVSLRFKTGHGGLASTFEVGQKWGYYHVTTQIIKVVI